MPDLQPFAENLWIIDGPPVRDMGVMFTTRMAVGRMPSSKSTNHRNAMTIK